MLSSLFPEWMPAWAQAVLLVGGILFTLVWLLVPFAVFGVKGRLDNLAIQLDDLQAELRVIAMGQQHAATAPQPTVSHAVPDSVAPSAPVWEPGPPQSAMMDHDGAGDATDVPAYERRAARVQPVRPATPVRPQPRPEPVRAPEPARAPLARHDIADEWDVLSSARGAPRPDMPRAPERDGADDRRESHDMPPQSEWSRTTPRGDTASRGARPVRASVWPPERSGRAEPTLRWPPRPE